MFDWSTHEYMLYKRHIGLVLRADEITSVALNEFLPLTGSSPVRDPRAIREKPSPSNDPLLDGVSMEIEASNCTGQAKIESKSSKPEECEYESGSAELRALRRALVRRFLVKLRAMLADYEQQREQHSIASSIILAYDYIAPAERAAVCRALDALSDAGDDGFCNPNSCSSYSNKPCHSSQQTSRVKSDFSRSNSQTGTKCSCTEAMAPGTKSSTAQVPDVVVRMIDFARAVVSEPPGSPDENVLFGMRNLIRYFESIETLLES